MKFIHILLFGLTLMSSDLYAQNPNIIYGPGSATYEHEDIVVENQINTDNNFIIYYPNNAVNTSLNVIFYYIGWGQLNPGIVSGLIEHIVRKGNIVVFVRYHRNNVFLPFDKLLGNAISETKNSIDYLNTMSHLDIDFDNLGYMGHCMGASIVARLAADFDNFELPKPNFALPIQPGHFPGVSLSKYSSINESIKLLTIIGDNDVFVGTNAGYKIFNTGPATEFNNLVMLRKDIRGNPKITGGHEEPLMLSSNLDLYTTDLDLPVLGGILLTSENNADYYCFRKLIDALINCSFNNMDCEVAFGDTDAQRYMGEFDDGSPIRELKVFTHEEDFIEEQNVELFPNPFISEIVVHYSGSPIRQVEMINNLGKEIKISYSITDNEILIQPLFMPENGFYIIQLVPEVGNAISIPCIKVSG